VYSIVVSVCAAEWCQFVQLSGVCVRKRVESVWSRVMSVCRAEWCQCVD
jgi:hypothetical protein